MLNILTREELVSVHQWFQKFGPTDYGYLQSHYERFLQTRQFALENIQEKITILDVGAHWLHNAFFYANEGHALTCMDAPDTLRVESVVAAADAMKARLLPSRSMERAEGLSVLEDNTVDLVLFCEIIEHLAFNPIRFWKEIYRVLKPGGKIVVTTPNAFYYKTLGRNLQFLLSGRTYGISVSEIMRSGTYGHHWKEFTLEELTEYFAFMSPDFTTKRFYLPTRAEDETVEIVGAMETTVERQVNVRAHSIYLEVLLTDKLCGINVSAPWDVE